MVSNIKMAETTDLNIKQSSTARETTITVILNALLTYITLSTDVINNWWQPVKHGFYCFDESISHPLYHNSVPTKTLFVFALALPLLVIIVTELYVPTSNSTSKKFTIFKTLADGFFGLICVCLITNMTKYVVGRQR